ncbi:Heptahelical transmembrane protein ADIPOR3 [Hibiscus syriacus]|uniref:Heptahelical transmembrane protein ADIPOR3 n=1 Tax=Hibiscus syriacus TaxID=106335 RepID=A0A6A3A6N8_HIBSY|nr:Heptahelical transmembrane protein ADIPOR3 [Hibiscus syriacus]
MKVPKIVDLQALQQISDALKKADLHKLQSEIRTCLPSLPNMPDLNKLREELKTSIPLMDLVPSISIRLSYDIRRGNSRQDNPEFVLKQGMKEPITRWPFFAFLGGAMFCLLASSTCHLLSCHSERLSYIMLRLDYAGIAALIATSFNPPVYTLSSARGTSHNLVRYSDGSSVRCWSFGLCRKGSGVVEPGTLPGTVTNFFTSWLSPVPSHIIKPDWFTSNGGIKMDVKRTE